MNIKYIVLLLSITILSACGGGSFDRQYHIVTKIIDGNTIEVDNGVQIDLIGVQDTKKSREYLEQNMMDHSVRIVYDTKHRKRITSKYDKAPGYVVTRSQMAVNGDILKRHLSGIDAKYLSDSLQVYQLYVHGERLTGGNNGQTPRSQPGGRSNPTGDKDKGIIIERPKKTSSEPALTKLIRQVKPAVFIIYNSKFGDREVQGTGFFISSYGLAVTNYHVVEGSRELLIKTSDQTWYSIDKIISADKEQDYAIFNVVSITNNFNYVNLNNRQPLQGEEVFVLGNPRGLESTVTRGVVSAVRTDGPYRNFIQIDAAISPGSSGSPVFDMDGNVVGMATGTIKGECQNCNFALKASIIKEAMENIDF